MAKSGLGRRVVVRSSWRGRKIWDVVVVEIVVMMMLKSVCECALCVEDLGMARGEENATPPISLFLAAPCVCDLRGRGCHITQSFWRLVICELTVSLDRR